MITLAQARYLLAIHQMRGRDRNVSKLAEALDVSKPSVTNMITSLEEKTWVNKGPPFVLTEQGQATVEEILWTQSLLSKYFSGILELPKEEISNDMLILMTGLSDESLNRLVSIVETHLARAELEKLAGNVHLTSFQGIIDDGVYEAPFQLLKEGSNELSMGDKGLVHPAELIVTGSHGMISLKVKSLKHRALHGALMKGVLAQLFYWNGETFTKAQEEDGIYFFPVMGMYWNHDKEKNIDFGVVKVRVHASVGSFNMPDSVADLAIYLE